MFSPTWRDATAATSPPDPAADDDRAVGPREAHEHPLPETSLAVPRYARANALAFSGPAGKRGAELLYWGPISCGGQASVPACRSAAG
ncbi:hypothetical protein [Streptomyces chryseus]|uniref:hypothetical protein n=1 Tax=Streptomyces chryseus TaxID=68186 RepID=UPI00110FA40E|nr:hypothetical protein [Streptomyces chryseus]